MDVRTLYTKIRNGSEHQVQEMQVIMESFLKQRSRSFSELNHKEQAERLMRYSDLSLESISLECGFSSYANFYKAFRAEKGENPGEVLKRMR